MRVLLDENMPGKVVYDFGPAHEAVNVRDAGWAGKKNGELLSLATEAGFEVFVTMDRNLKNQQNLDRTPMKFFVLLAVNNKPQTVQPFVEIIKAHLLQGAALPKVTVLELA